LEKGRNSLLRGAGPVVPVVPLSVHLDAPSFDTFFPRVQSPGGTGQSHQRYYFASAASGHQLVTRPLARVPFRPSLSTRFLMIF